jgi:hypothetical protein
VAEQSDRPSGTITFLFTDVEGSLARRYGAQARLQLDDAAVAAARARARPLGIQEILDRELRPQPAGD